MKIYHFTAAHLLPAIKRRGITMGTFPLHIGKRYKLINNLQWLTSDPDKENQSWATKELIDYDRTAIRITVDIPEYFLENLVSAREFVKNFTGENKALVEEWEGSESWFIYKGQIPPGWIVGVRDMNRRR